MKQFSLKTLFIITLVVAIAIIVIPFVRFKLAERRFHQAIDPIWAQAPYSSSLVEIKDTNDIVLKFCEIGLQLDSGGTLAKLPDRGSGCYELDCAEGKFYVMVDDGIYESLGYIISGLSPYCLLRDALMLDNESPTSTADLWQVRSLMMPVGCEDRLQHFESFQKKGFISGRLTGKGETHLVLFDSTGQHSILVVASKPKIDAWDRLAERLCLVEDTEIEPTPSD
ncbi:hypothetical protein N9Z44_00405 [Mariniblastus sp.]|nr:hypothetical protein [Mariniblastus sp.]